MKRVKDRLYRSGVFRALIYSFPFRLVLLNLKKNITFLLFWLLFFGFITKCIGLKYGVPFLFLDPEYMDETGFLSFLVVGFSCGGFIMAYNISSYVMNSFRFPFLATLSNPFWKYTLNNFFIPAIFVITYCFEILYFQKAEGRVFSEILEFILGFLSGIGLFVLMSYLYFFRTNKDIYKMFGIRSEGEIPKPSKRRVEVFREMGVRNPNLITESRDWYVETYFAKPFRVRLVRPVRHYKRSMLRAVFRQNHKSAILFEMTAIISLLILGLFRDYRFFMVPAGASIFLLFTMYLMLLSALFFWFRGWATGVLILLFLIFNYTFRLDVFDNTNKAYGINYNGAKSEYSFQNLAQLANDTATRNWDVNFHRGILEAWRNKNSFGSAEKPKLVLINTSGGGLRSTLWTFTLMQYADSLLDGKLMEQTHLITGSSGGMIGAAYYRELYLGQQDGRIRNRFDPAYRYRVAQDILNPVAFSIAVNDWFFPIQKFRERGHVYPKDRAYAFEKKLNRNTDNLLNKTLSDYREPEQLSKIPIMCFSPTIINDGRKLYISSLPSSFLITNEQSSNIRSNRLPDGIEFSRFFLKQNAEKTLFTSVLRMNATFPYISPVAELPSEPSIEVMDAGMRDNYGMETTLRYIYTFRKWIEENTSGIVILQVRDKPKDLPILPNPAKTISQTLSKPLNSFYGILFSVQDYNNNQLLEYCSKWFNGKIDVLDFELDNPDTDNISLSWHLTEMEKRKVLHSLQLGSNKEALKRLIGLLK